MIIPHMNRLDSCCPADSSIGHTKEYHTKDGGGGYQGNHTHLFLFFKRSLRNVSSSLQHLSIKPDGLPGLTPSEMMIKEEGEEDDVIYI